MPKTTLPAVLILLFLLAPVHNTSGQAQQILLPPISNPAPDGQGLSPAYTGCGGTIAPLARDAYEQRVVELVNVARADEGLPPLKRSQPYSEAARYHTADLGQDNYFDHSTYDRKDAKLVYVCSAWDRIGAYTAGARAENAAAGYSTPEQVMAGWMGSAGHRGNILNPGSREIGVGYYSGSGDYHAYWVQDFGARSGEYPLIINREAGTTDQREVSLYIHGDWETMRLHNDDGAWTGWQPFLPELDWELPPTAGEHSVDAELRAGNLTVTSRDSITLLDSGKQFAPVLGNLPDSLSFTYSLPDQELIPASQEVTPLNVGNTDPLSWEADLNGDLFSASPSTGITPDPIQILPGDFSALSPGNYTGSLTITVTDPTDVDGSPHTIDLKLQVIDTPIQRLFVPGVIHFP